MPRSYKRKTDAGLVPSEAMSAAVLEVVEHKHQIRKVAKQRGISKSTLQRYVDKFKKNQDCSMSPNYTHAQVFPKQQELALAEYLKKSSKMFHGLTTTQVRQLAYQMAERNKLSIPTVWKEKMLAGADWLQGFLRRNPTLSVRTPEATSLARATAFNKYTVTAFFDLLEDLILKLKITGDRIFNLDETGLTTVQKVPKVISEKGLKQVGQVTSRERGELVTVCGIVSATGVALPPAVVFPRKNYKEVYLSGAPEGSRGLAAASGWMNSELFSEVMKHLVKKTRSTKEDPIILVIDNHESHLSVETLEYAKENGVHVITLPPHTSQKTQPLDRSVYGPLKKFFNDEANSWMMQNPGKTITIYKMGQLIGAAWAKASTPSNIMSGFRTSGIWPFNRNVFSDDDFLPSALTDHPDPVQATQLGPNRENNVDQPVPSRETSADSKETSASGDGPGPSRGNSADRPGPSKENRPDQDGPSRENNADQPSPSKDETGFVSPEIIRSYPKAPMRKESNRGRKRGRTMVATSTPEMKKLRDQASLRQQRKSKKSRRKLILKTKKDNANTSESEEENDDNMVLSDTDDDESPALSDNDGPPQIHLGSVSLEDVKRDTFVLVQFKSKKSTKAKYYVAKVMDVGEEIIVEYLRKSTKVANKFVHPRVEDEHPVDLEDIKAILPAPVSQGTTTRTKGGILFSVDFGNLDVQ